MRPDTILFRLSAVAAIAGLSIAVVPPPAWAQADAGSPEISPPSRVGALTRVRGTVSYYQAGADSWSPAAVNQPVTTGEGFWTQPDAEARIDVSASDLVMAGATELEVTSLDDRALVATLPQGEVYLRVRALVPGETYTVLTPRGAVSIAAPGRYEIAAGDTENPTRVTVLEGGASLAEGASAAVPAGQAAMIAGEQAPFQVQLGPATRDAFLDHALAEERPARPQTVPLPPLVAQMPGGAELADAGTWSQTPQYGAVWYPEVAAGWVPYREGQWSYVAPWGWTWVDSNSWGFAPFHYGRWVDIGGRWAWTPGARERVAEAPSYPVYAPALVTFLGIGAVAVTGAMLADRSVGWVPLGPGEVYRPWFNADRRYVRDVNIQHVTNITEINNVYNAPPAEAMRADHFRNAAAATVVPAAAMATSRPLAGLARPASAQVLAEARPVFGHAPVPLTTATAGVTPAVARALHAVPPPSGYAVPARPAAPGPVIRAQAGPLPAGQVPIGPTPARPAPAGPVAGEARPLATPPLPRAGVAPGVARPSGPPGSPPPAGRGATMPALRPPGATPPVHPGQPATPPPPLNAAQAGRPPGPVASRPAPVPAGELARHPASTAQIAPHPTPPAPPVAIRPSETGPRPAPGAPLPHVVAPATPALHPATPTGQAFHPPAAPIVHAPPAPVAPVVHPPSAPAAPVFHPQAAPPAQRPAPPPAVHPAPPPASRPAPPPAVHAPPAPAAAAHPAPRPERRPGEP